MRVFTDGYRANAIIGELSIEQEFKPRAIEP